MIEAAPPADDRRLRQAVQRAQEVNAAVRRRLSADHRDRDAIALIDALGAVIPTTARS